MKRCEDTQSVIVNWNQNDWLIIKKYYYFMMVQLGFQYHLIVTANVNRIDVRIELWMRSWMTRNQGENELTSNFGEKLNIIAVAIEASKTVAIWQINFGKLEPTHQ